MRSATRMALAGFVVGAATLLRLSGCGGDGGPSGPGTGNGSGSPPEDVVGAIAGNHGHVAVITGTQLQAGRSATVSLTKGDTDDHQHTVGLSSIEVQRIAGNERVSKPSSTGGTAEHFHIVTFR